MSSKKQLQQFDATSFNLAALGDDYGIKAGSFTARAVVQAGNNRLKMENDRFAVKKGKELVKLKKHAPLEVVIHAFPPDITQRQLFAKDYDPKNADYEPPICWSENGNVPSPDVERPMGQNCKTCKKGSNGDRKCSFTSRLVVSLYDPGKENDDELPELLDFNLNSGCLFSTDEDHHGLGVNFRNYIRWYQQEMKLEVSRFVTLMSFNIDNPEEYSNQLLFRPIGPIQKDGAYWRVQDETGDDELLDRVKMDFSEKTSAALVAGDEDEYLEEEDLEEDEEEEEDEPPVKKKRASRKAPPKKAAVAVVEEDDEDEDEEEDEEEPPVKKKRASRKAPAKKAAVAVVEEDDEDDDDDEEDEPPVKAKAKAKAKAKPARTKPTRRKAPVKEDDDDDDDDDSEDEETPPKKTAKAKGKGKAPAAPVDDDDDDEIDLDELDEALADFMDEDDEYEDDED